MNYVWFSRLFYVVQLCADYVICSTDYVICSTDYVICSTDYVMCSVDYVMCGIQHFIQDYFAKGREIGLGEVSSEHGTVFIYILMFSVHVVIKFQGEGGISWGPPPLYKNPGINYVMCVVSLYMCTCVHTYLL